MVFEMYPGCLAPTADDWRSLDDMVQTPAYKFLERVTTSEAAKIIPEKSEIVWGNAYPSSGVSNQTFMEELKTLLPKTYKWRLPWWRHQFEAKWTTSVRL